MKNIKVEIPGKSYPVLIGGNILKELPKQIEKLKLNKNVFAVVDRNVYNIYKNELEKVFASIDGKYSQIIINAKEKEKSLATMEKIFAGLIKNNFGRDTVIIAVGGGITGDIAGFVAASFSRGVQYVQVPTTLLAAVDSSVGGKTGVNFGDTKNIIGAFHQPELVLFDINFLKTLQEKELLCGVGEIVKYAFLSGESYYRYASKNIDELFGLKEDVVYKFVGDSVKYKAAIVAEDEKESGLRKVLNLGHTFAHAFEVEQSHKLKHGEAVILGIVCSLFLSYKLNILTEGDLKKYLGFFNRFLGRIKLNKPDLNKIYKIMFRDKKNRNGIIKFVLAKSPGEILLDIEAEKKDVYFALRNGLQLFS